MLIPSETTLEAADCAVPLALYARIVGYDENAWWGVKRPIRAGYECFHIITLPERMSMQRYLMEAQEEIEEIIGYPVRSRWIADEKHTYSYPLLTKHGHVIEAGIRATDVIKADVAVTHQADDVMGNPQDSYISFTTSVTSIDEIRVCYPASLGVEDYVEVDPSDIDLNTVTGMCTIHIPRCRLVHPSYVDNPNTGLEYTNAAYFLDIVDVIRVHNDPSIHATLIWPHTCSGSTCTCLTCGEYTKTGCIYIAKEEIGSLEILPATYSGGTWTRQSTTCSGVPEIVLINYRAGMVPVTRQAQDAILRLAHSKMPGEPCGCERAKMVWQRDVKTPAIVTRERINCPFGLTDGAWAAWVFAMSPGMRLIRGSAM